MIRAAILTFACLLINCALFAQSGQPGAVPASSPQAQPASRPPQVPAGKPTGSASTQPARPAKKEFHQPPRPTDELVYVRLQTDRGNIDLELNKTRAPISVANFLAYLDEGHYDGTIFHRVMRNFVVQGGGMTSEMKEKKVSRAPIKNECTNGLKNAKRTVAMARTAALDSATSQFYFNMRWNDSLDIDGGKGGYAVFGQVVSGWPLVEQMSNEQTIHRDGHQSVPAKPVTLVKATRITKDDVQPDDRSEPSLTSGPPTGPLKDDPRPGVATRPAGER